MGRKWDDQDGGVLENGDADEVHENDRVDAMKDERPDLPHHYCCYGWFDAPIGCVVRSSCTYILTCALRCCQQRREAVSRASDRAKSYCWTLLIGGVFQATPPAIGVTLVLELVMGVA